MECCKIGKVTKLYILPYTAITDGIDVKLMEDSAYEIQEGELDLSDGIAIEFIVRRPKENILKKLFGYA